MNKKQQTKCFDVIVLGGGAAGMMCACTIKKKSVAVIDALTKPAKKIMVTGNGKCNLTNLNCDSGFYNQNIDKFLERFGERETLMLFAKLGLVTYADDEGRVYPISNSAKSVVDVLEYGAKNASFFLGEKIKDIQKDKEGFLVSFGETTLRAKNLVVATGGNCSQILDMLGVKYKEFVPSLVSLQSKQTRDLNGVRISNVLVTATNLSGEKKSERGEVLFRENGLSGIVVFNLSSIFARTNDFSGNISIDLLPDMDRKAVEKLVERRKQLDTTVDKVFVGMFANAVSNEIFKQSKINTNKSCQRLQEKEISTLADKIKKLEFEIEGHLENNQVFSGGVPLENLDEKLMYKNIPNLFIVGEACDIDGVCGGFNLQWAWTSGHIVGEALC